MLFGDTSVRAKVKTRGSQMGYSAMLSLNVSDVIPTKYDVVLSVNELDISFCIIIEKDLLRSVNY